MNKLVKSLFIAGGTLSVALAILGIIVPVLPTTPFLLLAAFLYARSSERFLRWLLTNRLFGTYITNYREGRGIPLRAKVLAVSALWLTMSFSVLCVVQAPWERIVLVLVALGVTAYLIRVRTCKPKPGTR